MYHAVWPLSSSSPTDTDLTLSGKSMSEIILSVIILDISSAVVVGMSSRTTSILGKTYLFPRHSTSTESSPTSSFASGDLVGRRTLWSSSSIMALSSLLSTTKSMIIPSGPMSPSSLSLTM